MGPVLLEPFRQHVALIHRSHFLAAFRHRLRDQTDPVPDEIWNEAARHYDEQALAALILSIATTNVYNRLNVSTRQVAGSWA